MSLQDTWLREDLKSKANPRRWMSWLLEFSSQDIGELAPREWTRLSNDLYDLLKASPAFDLARQWQGYPVIPTAGFSAEKEKGLPKELRDAQTLREIQGQLQDALKQLVPNTFSSPEHSFYGEWQLPATIRETRLTSRMGYNRRVAHRKGKRIVRLEPFLHTERRDYADWPAVFWLAVVELITECGALLRRCRECNKLYLKEKQQAFCSKRCSQRARSSKWYYKHKNKPEVKKRLRQAYLKWKRKEDDSATHDRARVKRQAR